MLIHPTLDKLRELNLIGMQQALIEQMSLPDRDTLTFDERFGMLVALLRGKGAGHLPGAAVRGDGGRRHGLLANHSR